MGVLNVTPDSFSDGGRFTELSAALDQADAMVEAGAAILDIGGESSRPGARPLDEAEELRRVLPVIDGLKGLRVPISIDTRRTRVMREAVAAGASMVNDIEALRAPGATEFVAGTDCAVCLMHMRGEPATMQLDVMYGDVVSAVRAFLIARVSAVRAAGVAAERIVVDPGFGFGKTAEHNLVMLRHLSEFTTLGVPLLVGFSRKATLGAVTGRAIDERLAASVAAALLAAQRGAKILRVHDVKETADALAVWRAASAEES